MTLAMVLVTALACLSSGCSLLFAARMAKLSREASDRAAERAEKASRTASLHSAAIARRAIHQSSLEASASRQMAQEVAQAAMSAATAMIERTTSTLWPGAFEKPPTDSDRQQEQRRAEEENREPWTMVPFGAEAREEEEAELEAAMMSRLSRTWPAGTVPNGAGMPGAPEPPAGWSERAPHPGSLAQEDDAAAAERYHRERTFDPSP